ncbi:galactose-specific lectin nattectin-like [Genypterus blacodes]|uniref:galactose-specific lectin nattectin-like n=1 Tax=Genypterus blacodes TaxID=154954 RepID=UPI003F76E642
MRTLARALQRRYHTHVSTWTGLHDALKEGRWFYTDGSRSDYKRWAKGEPNNWKEEDCVVMYSTAHLNDVSCEVLRPYICARRARR